MYEGMCTRLQVLVEARGIRSPGAEIKDSCEHLDLGYGNQTHGTWKNSQCS